MKHFVVDAPRGIDFEPTRYDELDEAQFGTVSDDDYEEACLAGCDLREIGMADISPSAGYRVYRVVGQLFRDYRAARSAFDFGQPESEVRLQEASSRLHQVATSVLANFPGRSAKGAA